MISPKEILLALLMEAAAIQGSPPRLASTLLLVSAPRCGPAWSSISSLSSWTQISSKSRKRVSAVGNSRICVCLIIKRNAQHGGLF